MPPKDISLSGVQKLYLKPEGAFEWQEIGTKVSDSISLGEMETEFVKDKAPNIGHFQITFRLRPWNKKKRIQIGQFLGFLKSPRCTYKTIKRDCAKRNKYKR